MAGERRSRAAAPRYLAAALAAVLVLAGVPVDVAAAGGRGGAMVVVSLKKGGELAGEFVTVRPDALVLLDPAGLDRTVDPADVRSVRVVRSSKGGLGGLIGLVVGAAVGYLGGFAASAASGACPDCEAPLAGYGLGVMGGLVGLGTGAAIGGAAGRDVVVTLDVKTAAERTAGLRRLRRYARVASPL